MNSSRRWLGIFAAAIAALAVGTLVLVLVSGGSKVDLLDEASPEGTVQRYLMAVMEDDWQQAYAYLSPDSVPKTGNFDDWLRTATWNGGQSSWKATLGSVITTGNRASVKVVINTFQPSWPPEDPVRTQEVLFELSRSGGRWLIVSPTYIYWIY